MKFLKNKKGLDFAALLLIVAIIVLGQVYFVVENKLETNFQKSLGEDQIAILNSYQKADNFLFYLDQSAKFSADFAIKKLINNAGLNGEKNNCKIPSSKYLVEFENKQFIILNTKVNPYKFCNSNIYSNFLFLFEQEFQEFVDVFPKSEGISLDNKGYEFLIENNKLYGFGLENFAVVIIPKKTVKIKFPFLGFSIGSYELEENNIGRYITKPSFMIPFTYNLDSSKFAYQKLENLVNECFKTKSQTTEGCVKIKANELGLTMQILNQEKGLYGFEINLIPNQANSNLAIYIPDIPK